MKIITTTLLSGCLAFAVGGAFAQSSAKGDSMAQNGTMKNQMTMQQCRDYMATKQSGMKNDGAMMKKSDGTMMKNDEAMTKQDRMCSEMMKKEGAKGGGGKEPGVTGTPK